MRVGRKTTRQAANGPSTERRRHWGAKPATLDSLHKPLSLPSVAPLREAPAESEEEAKLRFQVELEFVQALGNPNYLNFLAQREVLSQEAFVNYLKYLLYWKRPEYARFLSFPQALHFLELLQEEPFRQAMADGNNAKFVEDQAILQWQYYVRKRMRLAALPAASEDEAADAKAAHDD